MSEGRKTREEDAITDRLAKVRARIDGASSSRQREGHVLEEALAEKVWSALGRRNERAERFIAALRAKMAASDGDGG